MPGTVLAPVDVAYASSASRPIVFSDVQAGDVLIIHVQQQADLAISASGCGGTWVQHARRGYNGISSILVNTSPTGPGTVTVTQASANYIGLRGRVVRGLGSNPRVIGADQASLTSNNVVVNAPNMPANTPMFLCATIGGYSKTTTQTLATVSGTPWTFGAKMVSAGLTGTLNDGCVFSTAKEIAQASIKYSATDYSAWSQIAIAADAPTLKALLLTADANNLGAWRLRNALEANGYLVTVSTANVAADLTTAWGAGHNLVVTQWLNPTADVISFLQQRLAAGTPLMLGGMESTGVSNSTTHHAISVGILAAATTVSAASGGAATQSMSWTTAHAIVSGLTSPLTLSPATTWVVYGNGAPAGDIVGYPGTAGSGANHNEVAVAAGATLKTTGTAGAKAVFCGWLLSNADDNRYTDAAFDLIGRTAAWAAPAAPAGTEVAAPIAGSLASSSQPTAPASNLFDLSSSTYWQATTATPVWVQAQLPAPKQTVSYEISARADQPGLAPSTWTYQGSNDGVTWTTIDSQTGQTFSAAQTKKYSKDAGAAYLYYRLLVTAVGVTTDYPSFSEWKLNYLQPAAPPPGGAPTYETFSYPVRIASQRFAAGDAVPLMNWRMHQLLVDEGYIVPVGSLLVKRPFTYGGVLYPVGAAAPVVTGKLLKRLLDYRFIGV